MKTQSNSLPALPIEEAALQAIAQKMGAQISHVVYAGLVDFLILFREEIKQTKTDVAVMSTTSTTPIDETPPKPKNYKPFLTAGEIAKILGISKAKAYRLIQQKKIRSISIDKTVRVRWEDWEAFVQKHLAGEAGCWSRVNAV
jgi:excisionase family DNA binding protein